MYLQQSSKGFNPNIKERDIQHAFKMNARTEKFGLNLSDISAHTLRIIEIIEKQKTEIEMEKMKELGEN